MRSLYFEPQGPLQPHPLGLAGRGRDGDQFGLADSVDGAGLAHVWVADQTDGGLASRVLRSGTQLLEQIQQRCNVIELWTGGGLMSMRIRVR